MNVKVNGDEPETFGEYLVAAAALAFAGVVTVATLTFTLLLITAPLWFVLLLVWLLV